MQSSVMRLPPLVSHLLERAQQLFLRLPDRSLHRTTYVTERARRLASPLRAAGIHDGDGVGTLLWNDSVHLKACFGLPAARVLTGCFAKYQVLDDWVFAEAIGRTSTGTVERAKLREQSADLMSKARA